MMNTANNSMIVTSSGEELKLMGVYKIVNRLNGKTYIGSTIDSFKERMKYHIRKLRIGRHHNKDLVKDVFEYGLNNFEFIILKIDTDILKIRALEKEYIYSLKENFPKFCYNRGFNTLTFSVSESSKAKISTTLKQRYYNDETFRAKVLRMNDCRGESSWNKGLKCPNISKTRRQMFGTLKVFDLKRNLLREFDSVTDLVEYSRTKENDLPIILRRRGQDKSLMDDKVYLSIRTNKPYKGLYFEKKVVNTKNKTHI